MTRLDPATANLDGLTVIEASAGTGKTYAIQKLVARLVCEGVPVQRLLAMSYTNPAADELSERIRRELAASLAAAPADDPCVRGRLERALADVDLAQISTIHGFCQRMLLEHPAEAGVHGLEGWSLETDGSAERRRCCDEAWSALVEPDVMLDGLLEDVGVVRTVTRQADERESVRSRVMATDLPAAVQVLLQALTQLASSRHLAALPSMAEVMNVGFRRPAQALCDALAAVAGPGGAQAERLWPVRAGMVAAIEPLLKDALVLAAIPQRPAAAKRAAVDAVVSFLQGDDWRHLQDQMAKVVEASLACQGAAAAHVAADALRRLDHRRALLRTVNFDGLIRRLCDAVREPGSGMVQALRARFDVVIVDEVQDTDPMQAEILRRAFVESGRHRVILVGDPKQSIYGFRNADLDSYLALRRLCRKPTLVLDRSHRSDASMVRGVQALYATTDPFLNKDIPMAAVDSAHPDARLLLHGQAGAGLTLHHPAAGQDRVDPLQEAAWSIARALQQGWRVTGPDGQRDLRPGDIAVLCHKHWQGRQVGRHLRELGVPVMTVDRSSVFTTQAAADVGAVLAALAQPGSRSLALGALAGRITGLCASDALDRPDAWLARLRTCEANLSSHGVESALRGLVDGTAPEFGRLATLAGPEGERYAVDFDHVLEELQAAESAGVRGPAALADWIARAIADGAGGEGSLLRSVGGGDAVTLMTIHASKGLDFGVVWLPTFMTKEAAEAEGAAEPRRLLYVALTRAKYGTHVIWCPEPGPAGSPLAQLLHGEGQQGQELEKRVSLRLKSNAAYADLAAVQVRAQPGDIQLQPFQTEAPPPWQAPPAGVLQPARPVPAVPSRAVMLSFTALAHAKDRADHAPAERDVAGPDAPRPVRRPEGAGPFDAQVVRSGLRGTALGTLVHDSLAETAAFAALAAGASRAALVEALQRRSAGLRWRKDARVEPFGQALAEALAAPTGVAEIPSVQSLAAGPGRTLRELGLAVPWGARPSDLAEILRAEGEPWSEAVAAAVSRADQRDLNGLLVGNVDLVAQHEGRWFIYDYKTNDLGGDPAVYEPDALHAAMTASLYPLQAAIYAALLARWSWVRGGRRGDLATSIGGVAYLFVRGMHPSSGARGTWTWKPSARLIRRMHEALPMPSLEAQAS